MGVPAFFRWLTRKYPSVIMHCIEEKQTDMHGNCIPSDSAAPNPNGVEFDNLYLDMNGIIHPCTHPEDKPAPRNEDEMMIAIFECIDRLFRIVRPRKVLYMAIDGVAPRAKMNQQRSRRFRASKETVEKINEVDRLRAELLLKGAKLPPPKPKEEHFDSNCITPGTPFMTRLSQCLHYYIHDRLNNDPGWRGIKVILSDANVPGEGEHKIMDYIRKQRAQPDHDPNTQHCLCGADADLIMLGLATHEPNFTIIREELKMNQPRPCELCGQLGHVMADCVGIEALQSDVPAPFGSENEFIFVRLNVLREYLVRELQMPNLPFKYDFERVIDDWVFMCFFVGNDFLPHLPSLEIREGAIDRLIKLYKDAVYKTGGWLTNSGDVNLERVQLIMTQLGEAEDEIFKRRQQNELRFKAREKAKKRMDNKFNQNRPNWSMVRGTQFAPVAIGKESAVKNARQEAFSMRKAGMHTSAQDALESMLVPNADSAPPANVHQRGTKRPHDNADSDDDHQANDEVRLWEDGFKERYYESKFDVTADDLEFRYNVALHYVRGLCWVLRYYYQGCASWKWYFPYHYAPFASDFVNIAGLSTEFEMDTKPFNPLEQLMGVFPAASSNHVPGPWAELMSDHESPIIDFYPEDFKIDLNGKKFAWQGVALLPFVDEERLFGALKPFYAKLTEAEKKRNIRGDDRLYMAAMNKNASKLKGVYDQGVDADVEVHVSIDGMQGTLLASEQNIDVGGELPSPITSLPAIDENQTICVRFRDPKYTRGFVFPAVRLKGAISPPTVLKPENLDEVGNRNWRPQIGIAPARQRASVTDAGHRFVNHHVPRDNFNMRPDNYGGYNNRNRGGGGGNNYSSGGGYQGNRQGGYQGGGRGGYNQQQQGGGRWENPRENQYQSGPSRDRYVPNRGRGGGAGGGGGGYSTGYRR